MTEDEKPPEGETPPPPPEPEAVPPPTPPSPPPEGEVAPAEEAPPKEERVPPPKRKRRAPKKRPSYPLKLFERWDLSEITVRDKGLERYINLSPIVLPHTGGRYADKLFGKTKTSIIERLINNMMRHARYTGKKSKAIKIVRQAFDLVEGEAKVNPVQVFVDALERVAPREEITRLRFGGISVPRAVDIAPSRRLDLALRYICQGAVSAAFKRGGAKKDLERTRGYEPIAAYLASEILAASRGDMTSSAIAKKEEMERVAAAAR